MRIKNLRIENFRAIRHLELSNLPDAVVIAGPNGCGKSSIFHAIRLLKSAYGQYEQNEYQKWFNEFGININKYQFETERLYYNPQKPLTIQIDFELTQKEKEFILINARSLYLGNRLAHFHSVGYMGDDLINANPAMKGSKQKLREAEIEKLKAQLKQELQDPLQRGRLIASVGREIQVINSRVLELIFTTPTTSELGVIDYHGPNRSFNREGLGNINLKIKDTNETYNKNALYNTDQKYRNIKGEMASLYINQLLIKESGAKIEENRELRKSLEELFDIFFTGKKFSGPLPNANGELEFPVFMENGRSHDIYELSSGEKELLFGYLRIRNSAPTDSVILIDEPELHLNPRLIRGLTGFYQKHIGKALRNQLWLVTHSDTLLRDAMEEPSYKVFHMHLSHDLKEGSNQVTEVSAKENLENAIIDLVGNLAAYSPKSKVVFIEGEDSEFDLNFIQQLFPEFSERVNLVSVGPKSRVIKIHELLETASAKGHLDARFFSIVDKDLNDNQTLENTRQLSWDVYHIENYLLEARFIKSALRALMLGGNIPSKDEIELMLLKSAESSIERIIRIRMASFVNDQMVYCLSTKYDPSEDVTKGLASAAKRSLDSLNKVVSNDLNDSALTKLKDKEKDEMIKSLNNDRWKQELRGRDILKNFLDRVEMKQKVPYEYFRNIIISQMKIQNFKPKGMKEVLDRILLSD